MIISQALGLDQSDSHKPGYFGDPMSLTASVPSVGHNSGPTPGIYAPSDGYFISGRVQTDLPNIGMYAAQTDTSSISSPGNYVPNPATVATAPGLMGSHYATGLQPPAYPPITDDYEMRPAVGGVWHGGYTQPPPSCYPYESSFGHQYHYDRYCGVDINDGVRRKNATRESTNTLKAWLQEHKKNPYPTKGEKIMLAIITKMTLTQVSTWFANARRRLKKENKMTWVPKNRSSDSSNNSKKTDEDDDDVTSSHSNENDCKSDIDPSLDSDDSDARKVTSTNTNDDITSSDLKDTIDFQHEQCSINSDGTTHQNQQDFSSPVHDDHLRSSFGSYDLKEKTWSTSNDETGAKPADGIINSSGIGSYEGESCRSESSTVIRQASSLVSPSLMRSDDICEQTDLKYQSHAWPHIPYQYGSESNPNHQIQSNGSAEQIDPLQSHSPSHVGEVKSNFPRSTFSVSSVSESCAVAPAPSSFVHGYSSQHGVPPPHVDYYRGMERLPGDLNPSSYYPQHDLRARTELKADTIPSSFSSSGEPIQPKTPTLSRLSSSSLLASESAASVQKPIYQPNLSPQYVPNVKLVKSVPSSTTTHAPSYFPHNSFNQPFINGTGSTLDYYQRKGFYSPESSSYHMTASSPRK